MEDPKLCSSYEQEKSTEDFREGIEQVTDERMKAHALGRMALTQAPQEEGRDWFGNFNWSNIGLWVLIAVTASIVLPPFVFLLQTSFQVQRLGESSYTFGNYLRVLQLSGWHLWQTTLIFSIGSSCVSIVLGFSAAWLVVRTDVPFRQTVYVGAFLSLAAPLIVKGIGWIMLLGPNNGLINIWLMHAFGLESAPLHLYGIGGMIFVEGLLWTPVAFLLALPPLMAMDPSLEEASSACGARRWQMLWYVTLPLARPSIMAVFLLALIRSLESFEVPLLIGTPGHVETITTAIYHAMHSGFVPSYGEATAYSVLLMGVVALPLVWYYRSTRESARYATVTGKGFRPARIELGRWRWLCAAVVLIIPLSLAMPVLVMLYASFLPFYGSPSLDAFQTMSFDNYISIWSRANILSGIWNSVVIGSISATVVAGFTLLLAWMVIRSRHPARWSLDVLASLPLVFPGIVASIAIMILALFLTRWIPIYGTIWVLVLAFLLKFMPFGMRFCYSGILTIHKDLEESARASGAPPWTVLRKIVLPLTMPAVLATWIYVFMHAIRDLSTAILLSGPGNSIASVVILDLWNNGEIPELAALSIVICIGVTVMGVFFMRLSGKRGLKA